jgi:hypothetical protein
MMRSATRLAAAALVMSCAAGGARAAVNGFTDTFPGTSTANWSGGTALSNPGAGGVGGAGDGYLQLSSAFAGNFGTQNSGSDYTGDWTAAGITEVSFFLRDVAADQSFSFHFLLTQGGSFGTTWQYDTPMDPPTGQWQQYTVDLTSETNWTRVRGSDPLATVLQSVSFAHFRHDLEPYFSNPDPIAGDIGIDSIRLGAVPEPTGLAAFVALLSLRALRRRR